MFLSELKQAHETYSLPRWYNQSNLVEVWVEKDGLLGAVRQWTRDLDITIRAPQGYGAWEFINQNIIEIKEQLQDRPEGTEVNIIYLGDLDPSGKDIPRFMNEEAIEHFGLPVNFKEIALTPDQIHKFNLPQIPDAPEVMQKIGRDSRTRKYREEYGDIFCELDAFFSLATEEAKELIRSSVEELFDREIYEDSRLEEISNKEDVYKIIRQNVVFKDEK